MEISEKLRNEVLKFLKKTRKADIITTYLFFIEKKFHLKPVLFPREKMIYKSLDNLIKKLENEKKLNRENEIKIHLEEKL